MLRFRRTGTAGRRRAAIRVMLPVGVAADATEVALPQQNDTTVAPDVAGAEAARPIVPRREPRLKRALDILLALMGLVVSAPLWAVITLAIKLREGGPVFYLQERWGRGGRTFRVRKFRTMVASADADGIHQAAEDDRRITRTGRVLRAAGLDELPQLLNILRGEMSFVGPRALAVGERIPDGNGGETTHEQLPGFRERLAVRPGLTGLATIYLPKDISPAQKFAYDRLYVRNQSLLLDLRLIVQSIWISIRGRWETRQPKT